MQDPVDESKIWQMEADNRRLRDRYDRLRSRRSVRAALKLAALVGGARSALGRKEPGPEPPAPEVGQPPPEPTSDRRWSRAMDYLAEAPPLTVVVPVYEAFDALERCVDHVLRNTSTAHEILFIDDASEDTRVIALLDDLGARMSRVRVMRNEENIGFVRTANRGFELTEGDVILLNADTLVPPRWVERLRLAAYSSPAVASATALSNNAGAFSAPEVGHRNDLPGTTDADAAGRLVARIGASALPATPTANGFCVYIKRRALEDVGLFDAERYPRGYGEENDWSMRAAAKGWRHVVDDASYVWHDRTRSFSDEERADLSSRASKQLMKDHPTYEGLARDFVTSPGMKAARSRIGEALDDSDPGPVLPRVLIVLHDLAGGVPETTRDLATGLSDRYEPLILTSTGRRLVVTAGDGTPLDQVTLDGTLRLEDETSHDYREAVAGFLIRHDVEIVHIRHLMKHTLELAEVAQTLGLPVVLSVHDYYLLCPTAHLVDESGRFCGGRCTEGQGTCPASPWVAAGPHLKHGWVSTWQERVRHMLGSVDVLVTANETAADVHRAADGAFASLPWKVIEHGRDLDRTASVARFPESDEPIRIVLAGTIGTYKGGKLVRALKRLDADDRLEFHVLGTFPGPDDGAAIVHGRYPREDFAARVAEIHPAAVAVLSVTAETYSHVVTEAWASGIPVIVTDRGAPAARVASHGGGWIIDPTDPETAYQQIVEIFGDRSAWEQCRGQTLQTQWPSTTEMGTEYARLYDQLRASRRTAQPVP